MESTSYPVIWNVKIPWVTKTFYYLFIVCIVVLILLGLYMLPAMRSSAEMKAAYFILTTSDFQKTAFLVALLGTPAFYILYKLSRLKHQALLTLFPDKIEISSKKETASYSLRQITHIACNDALTHDGFPKGKLTIEIKDRRNKVVSLALIDYSQSEELMHKLLEHKHIKFHVTNLFFNPEDLSE